MSAAFQQKLVNLRAARIRKGEEVGERPSVRPRMMDFSSIASCLSKDDGEAIDLNAIAMGIRHPEPVRKVVKAERAEYVSGAIALDGVIGRERVMKADLLGFPANRDDSSADAHETKVKPPKPPEGEHVSYTDMISRINAAIAAAIPGLVAAVTSSLRIPADAPTGNPPASVAKADGGRITIRKFEHRERGTPGLFPVSAPNLGARLFGV